MGLRIGVIEKNLNFYVPATHSKIRPNQTLLAQVVYYILFIFTWGSTKKNLSSLGPMGAEKMGWKVLHDFAFQKLVKLMIFKC